MKSMHFDTCLTCLGEPLSRTSLWTSLAHITHTHTHTHTRSGKLAKEGVHKSWMLIISSTRPCYIVRLGWLSCTSFSDASEDMLLNTQKQHPPRAAIRSPSTRPGLSNYWWTPSPQIRANKPAASTMSFCDDRPSR